MEHMFLESVIPNTSLDPLTITMTEDRNMEIKDIFAERLKELMEQGGETVEQLSNSINNQTGVNVSVGSLVDYKKGRARANIEALYGIATYYGISTDWLLGLSNVKETSANLQQICNYTGLAPLSVERLHLYETTSRYKLPIKLIDQIMTTSIQVFESNANRAALARVQSDRHLRAHEAATSTAPANKRNSPPSWIRQADKEELFYEQLLQPNDNAAAFMVEIPARDASSIYRNHAVRRIEVAANSVMDGYIDHIRQLAGVKLTTAEITARIAKQDTSE